MKPTERKLTSALFELRMKELGISCLDEDEFTIGMIMDLLTEKLNDSAKYNQVATQEDIDRLLG